MAVINPAQPVQTPQNLPQPDANQYQTFTSNVSTDPSSIIQQIYNSFTPYANQAQSNQNAAMAAAGLSGGPTVALDQQLAGQLSGGLGNSLAGAIGNAQQMSLNQGEFNASQSNNAQQNLAQLLQQAYGQQFGAFNNLNSQGLSGFGELAGQYAGNFPVSGGAGAGASALGQGLGSYMSTLGGGSGNNGSYNPYTSGGYGANTTGLPGGGEYAAPYYDTGPYAAAGTS